MQLHHTADQALFRETTSRFIADTCPLTEVRRLAVDAELGYEPAWWRRAAELGWTSMLAPESLGGGSVSDDPVTDLALVAYERGRMASPGPFLPVNAALAALGDWRDRPPSAERLIEGLVAGDVVATIAVEDPGADPAGLRFSTSATSDSCGVTVSGRKRPVESALEAAAFVVAASLDGAPSLLLIDAGSDGVSVTRRGAVDLVRRFGSVRLDRVPATVISTGEDAVRRVLDIASVLQLSETVGAVDRVFEFTVQWAFDRHSFGRPLASYQELKHRFADMRTWLEASKATTVAAVQAAGTGAEDTSMLTSVAKAYVGQHAGEIVQDCVQMHGGLGVTWEHDIHLYLRRVMLNTATYGTVAEHRRRLGGLALSHARTTEPRPAARTSPSTCTEEAEPRSDDGPR